VILFVKVSSVVDPDPEGSETIGVDPDPKYGTHRVINHLFKHSTNLQNLDFFLS
jgi:hypothetical protein